MKRFKFSRVLPFFACLFLLSCGKEEKQKEVETFSEAKPYTLEILKDRSYFQADKVVNRLKAKSIDSYILKSQDSEGDDWYSVVSGAFASDSAMNCFKTYLDTALHIKAGNGVIFTELDSIDRVPVKQATVVETRRIEANKPNVPASILGVVSHYPQNDIFYLKNISLVSLTDKGISSSEGKHIDMPRGITLKKLKGWGFTAFGSVIYKDNLYNDEVTLQVAKFKEVEPTAMVNPSVAPYLMSFSAYVPMQHPLRDEAVDVCSTMADLVLKTGKYADKDKKEVEFDNGRLVGYKASFRLKSNEYRAYYFLVDQAGEYVYMLQSTKEDDTELIEFISLSGKSNGLEDYDEFYNSFYTIADELATQDEFIGYYVDRLDYRYARDRNYAKWANRMVGHWSTNVYFYNPVKGVWYYNIYDLLTEKKASHIYKKLYRDEQEKNSQRKIYGETGTALYRKKLNIYWELVDELQEISFSHDRYIYAASGASSYSEKNLVERAEKIQFDKGGYKQVEKSTDADDSSSEE